MWTHTKQVIFETEPLQTQSVKVKEGPGKVKLDWTTQREMKTEPPHQQHSRKQQNYLRTEVAPLVLSDEHPLHVIEAKKTG